MCIFLLFYINKLNSLEKEKKNETNILLQEICVESVRAEISQDFFQETGDDHFKKGKDQQAR